MNTETVIKEALAGRAHETGTVETSALVFSPALYKTCEENTCGNYNTCWSCPPAVGTLEEQREKILRWKYALVFTTKYDLEDSFDFDGMQAAGKIHSDLTIQIRKQFDAYPVYGAGSCRVCETCSYPEPCRFPGRAISSVEAAGINVSALSRIANLKYNNGPDTVTFFSMILFNG